MRSKASLEGSLACDECCVRHPLFLSYSSGEPEALRSDSQRNKRKKERGKKRKRKAGRWVGRRERRREVREEEIENEGGKEEVTLYFYLVLSSRKIKELANYFSLPFCSLNGYEFFLLHFPDIGRENGKQIYLIVY